MATRTGLGTTLTISSALLFSTSGLLAAAVMAAGWGPAQAASARIVLAALILLPAIALVRRRALRLRGHDLPLVFAMGLFGVIGAQLCYFIAVSRVSVGIAMVLEYMAPVLVALWIRVVRKARLRRPVWLGIGLAMLGLAMIAQLWQGLKLDTIGFIAGLGSAVSTAGYYLIAERGAAKHDPVGLTVWSMLVGAVLISFVSPPWTLPFHLFGAPTTIGGAHPSVWLLILLVAVVSTVLPYLIGTISLKWVSSTVASVLGLIEPLMAVVLAWVLLGQTLDGVQIAGAVVLLGGAALVQLTSRAPVSAEPLAEDLTSVRPG